MRGQNKKQQQPVSPTSGALDDSTIANRLRDQANKMSLEAKGLLAEAERLMKEASSMDPVKPVVELPKPRGRKPKAKVA